MIGKFGVQKNNIHKNYHFWLLYEEKKYVKKKNEAAGLSIKEMKTIHNDHNYVI